LPDALPILLMPTGDETVNIFLPYPPRVGESIATRDRLYRVTDVQWSVDAANEFDGLMVAVEPL
jgi:hypothetical protein